MTNYLPPHDPLSRVVAFRVTETTWEWLTQLGMSLDPKVSPNNAARWLIAQPPVLELTELVVKLAETADADGG